MPKKIYCYCCHIMNESVESACGCSDHKCFDCGRCFNHCLCSPEIKLDKNENIG